MALVEGTGISCGVRQVCDLSNNSPQDNLQDIYTSLVNNCAVFIWSDTTKNKNGSKLAALIRKLKLSRGLIRTAPVINPNSGNKIVVWVWTFPRKAFEAYAAEQNWTKEYDDRNEYDDEDYDY